MECVIRVGNVYSSVIPASAKIKRLVTSACAAKPAGYRFMPRFKAGFWDGNVSLAVGNSFPTGLLGLVCEAFRYKKIQYKLDWNGCNRTLNFTIQPDMLCGIELRDYQLDAMQTLLEAKRGIAKMATNAGKTEVFAGIIKANKIPQTIITVHRKELMYQTAERLKIRLGCTIGLYGDGIRDIQNITVCMIKTLYNDKNRVDVSFLSPEILIIDECHNTSSDTYMDVLRVIQAPQRYGFSGTPLKRDLLSDLKLIGMTGRVLVEITNHQLIEWGYSADPCVLMYEVDGNEKDYNLPYQEAVDRCIVNSQERNELVCNLAAKGVQSGETVLVFVNRIEHGYNLGNALRWREQGLSAKFVNGGDNTEIRQNVLQDMAAGQPGVYIATNIFDEGVDVPGVDHLIMAAGGESPRQLLQRIGRGLRKKDGENALKVSDFIDYSNKHLNKHSMSRMGVYIEEGFSLDYVPANQPLS